MPFFEPKHLKKIRVQVGMTQLQLARLAGVSQSLIMKVESGLVDPSIKTLDAIERALNLNIKFEGRLAADVMSTPVISVQSETRLSGCVDVLRLNEISQMPVLRGSKLVGSISEGHIVSLLETSGNPDYVLSKPVTDVIQPGFPVVGKDIPVEALFSLFKFVPAVLVGSWGDPTGIITKIDLLSSEASAP